MNRYWTHYWTQKTLEDHREQSGEQLGHTAGNQFLNCGVSEGDFVYCVSAIEGSVVLIARVQVDDVVSQETAIEYFGESIWKAKDHVIAKAGTGSVLRLDRIVPMDYVRKLRFITKMGETRVTFQGDGIDQQTLRRVRELTETSARLLDKIIDRTDA